MSGNEVCRWENEDSAAKYACVSVWAWQSCTPESYDALSLAIKYGSVIREIVTHWDLRFDLLILSLIEWQYGTRSRRKFKQINPMTLSVVASYCDNGSRRVRSLRRRQIILRHISHDWCWSFANRIRKAGIANSPASRFASPWRGPCERHSQDRSKIACSIDPCRVGVAQLKLTNALHELVCHIHTEARIIRHGELTQHAGMSRQQNKLHLLVKFSHTWNVHFGVAFLWRLSIFKSSFLASSQRLNLCSQLRAKLVVAKRKIDKVFYVPGSAVCICVPSFPPFGCNH